MDTQGNETFLIGSMPVNERESGLTPTGNQGCEKAAGDYKACKLKWAVTSIPGIYMKNLVMASVPLEIGP